MTLELIEQTLAPVRGLVLMHNARGVMLKQAELERWIRLNRFVFKTPKIDLFHRACDLSLYDRLCSATARLDVRFSLRTACAAPPPMKQRLERAGLLDVFLCPDSPDAPEFEAWLDRCRGAELPIRVQFTAPFEQGIDIDRIAQRVTDAGVNVVNIALWDPFSGGPPARNAMHSTVTVNQINALANAFDREKIELNILRVPRSLVDPKLHDHVLNHAEALRDFQQYEPHAYELAGKLWRLGPRWAGKAVLMLLCMYTSRNNPIDARLFPWIIDYPWVRARIWAVHKLLRHRNALLRAPSIEPEGELLPGAKAWIVSAPSQHNGDIAAKTRRSLPGLSVQIDHADVAYRPTNFTPRPRYYDAVDAPRAQTNPDTVALAEKANDIVLNRAYDREIASFDFGIEGHWAQKSPGNLGWFSLTNSEKVSTPLATLDPPFTMSFTVGGGIAEFAGFCFGRHAKLVCPMVAYSHRIVLHVAKDGRYVLLRDGLPVKPVEFVGEYYAPIRLGNSLEPRISLWNIDGSLGTQAVYIWEGKKKKRKRAKVKVSIVMVSTRYARRLQAVLQNLAFQRGIAMDEFDVHVAFVPGIDATGDVLDSIALAHPDLRIVRTAFAPEHTTAKGFMLNECIAKATGDWIVVLDADVLLHPTALSKLIAMKDKVKFVVPDGRKMLTPETTARILLGEIEPWSAWDDLIEDAGEYRFREAEGVPLGYCQCVRRECLEQVRYEEFNNFEGADWKFGRDMRDTFGLEKRLSGLPVLHLDHGSSNWYGASRHL